jgi:hypothetical protein
MFVLHNTDRLEAIMPWKVVRLGPGRVARHQPVRSFLDYFYRKPAMELVASLRFTAGILVIIAPAFSVLSFACLFLLLLIIVADSYRNPMGGEGADQMHMILVVSLAIGSFPGSTSTVRVAALLFIAAQSLLSYAASGFAKLISPIWRSGVAISGILSTRDYGIPAVGEYFVRHRSISTMLAWMTIVFECAFILAVSSPWVALVFITLGICFHAGVAVIMGLNAFLIAFPATYPALFWLSEWAWR